jgi:L-threonylcarbamoyladenylate synthase
MFLLRDDINEIAALLNQGAVICYPTDTIWGIGCNMNDEAAVSRLRTLKNFPATDGLIILVSSIEMLRTYVPDLSPRIETLLSLHNRPFTLIYKKNKGVPDWIRAKDGSVAIRFTHDEFCKNLIEATGVPIVSTTAAMYGNPHPPHFGAISSEILGKMDYVVKYRQDDKTPGDPSPLARIDQFQELDFIRE